VYSDLAAVGLSMLELTKYDIRSQAFESFLRYISQDVPQSRGSVQEALDMLITLMDDALLDEDESSSLFYRKRGLCLCHMPWLCQ
jgi:hypothetical protein